MKSRGEQIAQRRRDLKFTQNQLAEKSGAEQSHISNLERGFSEFTLTKTTLRIVKALDMNPVEFFTTQELEEFNYSDDIQPENTSDPDRVIYIFKRLSFDCRKDLLKKLIDLM